ncbi:hypothetical protein F5888DRAFT_1643307 [Russula emetica]|nr:hypothetical protein F5888DRAFT_1643307 [Russula emetica]
MWRIHNPNKAIMIFTLARARARVLLEGFSDYYFTLSRHRTGVNTGCLCLLLLLRELEELEALRDRAESTRLVLCWKGDIVLQSVL